MSTQAAYGIASLSGNCGETEDIDVNDLKTLTQSQKEEKEAVQRAIEEENQRLKEAGFRQTDPSLILQLTMKCTPLELIVLIKPYYGIVLMGQSQHLNLI